MPPVNSNTQEGKKGLKIMLDFCLNKTYDIIMLQLRKTRA